MPAPSRIVVTKQEYVARVLFGTAQKTWAKGLEPNHSLTWANIPEDKKSWWRDLAKVAIQSGQRWDRVTRENKNKEKSRGEQGI